MAGCVDIKTTVWTSASTSEMWATAACAYGTASIWAVFAIVRATTVFALYLLSAEPCEMT